MINDMKTIWNYYKVIAENAGTILDEEGKAKDAPYSVKWFYDGYHENKLPQTLNELSKAFLGDATAFCGIKDVTDKEITSRYEAVKTICGKNKNATSQSPNESQIQAIAHAIDCSITIIQGPPGTGKTQTIKNLLSCLMSRNNRPTVAVVSTNSEAIDNIIELVDKDQKLKNLYAYLGKRSNRMFFAKQLSKNNPKVAALCKSCNKKNDYKFPPVFLQHYPIIFSTIHSLRKCFDCDSEDPAFRNEFDYVIVDECSQVPSYLGLLAMASAKHLVLSGDDEQLPPIHKGYVEEDTADKDGIKAFYRDEKENSFMKACRQRFQEKAAVCFLNGHYRCHPAIIGFCNQEVYQGRLEVKTKEDGRVPIRVRWYEGDYWENESKTMASGKYNEKQIQVFMEDEYPLILKKLKQNPEYSVCVLSPYKTQLQRLQKALISYEKKNRQNMKDIRVEYVIEGEGEEAEEGKAGVNKIPQLTIHKAQGRGYDLVYIMPVEDTGSSPWSQRKSIMNVAVSRAKKELCVITSSAWMPVGLQKALCDDSGKNKYIVSNLKGKPEGYYLCKLLEYVKDERERTGIGLQDEEYGFHRSEIRSVFDRIPYYRKNAPCRDHKGNDYKNKTKVTGKMSAPEYCMLNALSACGEIRDNYSIYREVPVKNIRGMIVESKEVKDYINRGAKFDIVLAKDGRVHGIIEVDGAYHRTDEEVKKRDKWKDQAAASLGKEFEPGQKRFLRLPTDGTTRDEVAMVKTMLVATEKELPILDEKGSVKYEMRQKLVNYFHDKMKECVDIINCEIKDDRFSDELEHILMAVDYKNPKKGDLKYGEKLADAVYLLKYGYVYAFEYVTMYEILLKNYEQQQGNIFGVTTFGCGSLIDAWALAYVKTRLGETAEELQDISLRYVGIDLKEWKVRFLPEENSGLDEIYPNNTLHYPEATGDAKKYLKSIERCLKDDYWHWYNTIFFSQVLNELDDNQLDELVTNIRGKAEQGKMTRDEYYICIAHSPSSYENDEKMQNIAARIVEAMGGEAVFDIDDKLPEKWELLNPKRKLVRGKASEGKMACYEFPTHPYEGKEVYDSIGYLNEDFKFLEEVNDCQERIKKMKDDFRYRTQTRGLAFQIIKLTRKEAKNSFV